MNGYVDTKTCFNDITKDLTLKRYYVLLVSFPFHGLSDDFGLVVFFIVFPKMVDDPEVDEQFQEDKAVSNYLRSVSKSLVQDWIKFIHLKKKFEIEIELSNEGSDPLGPFGTLSDPLGQFGTFRNPFKPFGTL